MFLSSNQFFGFSNLNIEAVSNFRLCFFLCFWVYMFSFVFVSVHEIFVLLISFYVCIFGVVSSPFCPLHFQTKKPLLHYGKLPAVTDVLNFSTTCKMTSHLWVIAWPVSAKKNNCILLLVFSFWSFSIYFSLQFRHFLSTYIDSFIVHLSLVSNTNHFLVKK